MGRREPSRRLFCFQNTSEENDHATLRTCHAGVPAGLRRAGASSRTALPLPAPPLFATTKVEGTDNVYIFRYQGHQAMFIVTPEGVIATDPIGRYRPQAVTTYLDEIRKITSAPVRYVIYSHHHYDHIAGGKPFKDAGATFVAHKRAKERACRAEFPRRDAGR